MTRWDVEYRNLPTQTRAAVNELVNAIFRQQTGFQGKIDLKAQPQLSGQVDRDSRPGAGEPPEIRSGSGKQSPASWILRRLFQSLMHWIRHRDGFVWPDGKSVPMNSPANSIIHGS